MSEPPTDRPEAARPHLMVATPCYGGAVSHSYMLAVMQLFHACTERGIDFELEMVAGDALVSRARNMIAATFMGSSATHLLCVDADIAFQPDAVFRMLDLDKDFCGGLYPAKSIDWQRVHRSAGKGPEALGSVGLHYVAGLEEGERRDMRGTFTRASFVGSGFVMLRRRVFEVLQQAHPELRFRHAHVTADAQDDQSHRFAFFDPTIDAEGFHLSDDHAFCTRWRAAGGEIWVDLASQLTHLGAHSYVGDTRWMLP